MQSNRNGFSAIIGESIVMQEVITMAKKIVASNAVTVLITGKTGTGKELMARALHHNSSRNDGAFVEVNCSAIPENLLEAELFGYEQGAFTDARGRKQGLFELASGGTLFLDEIGYMTANLQVKLLKAIEEKRIRRVGGTEDIDVDIRVIAATNRDLEAAIRKGSFREDLYYRLNVIAVELPPLMIRGNDILLLAEYFVKKFCTEYNKPLMILSDDAKASLMAHRWPGNVREMKNAVERAVLLGEGTIIEPDDIRITVRQETSINSPEARNGRKIVLNIPDAGLPLDDVERKVVGEMLRLTNWNKSKAARMLHIPRPRLLRKIAKYDLTREMNN